MGIQHTDQAHPGLVDVPSTLHGDRMEKNMEKRGERQLVKPSG